MTIWYWTTLLAAGALPAPHVPPQTSALTPPPALAASEPFSAQAELTQAEIATIQAQRDRHQRITVPVTIQGSGPFRFMVDTGAQATVISSNVSDRLGLAIRGQATLVGMASARPVDLVRLDRLAFADREYSNIMAPRLNGVNLGADGILGLDSLQDLRILLNFKEDRISIADAGEASSAKGYEIVVRARRKLGQMIITNARIDGVKTAVVIDTGAQTSMGNAVLKRKLRARNRSEIISTDVNGAKISGEVDIVRRLQLGTLELENLPIAFADGPAFHSLGLAKRPALILGMDALRSFDRVAIDFRTRKILFDLPGTSYTQSWRRNGFFPSRIRTD